MPGRKVSLASLAAKTVEEVPGQASPILERLRPEQIAPTPMNSRDHFGTDEELAELGESLRVRQLQPVVVVERADYLRLWPEHEGQLGTAGYILVNGERRWRAAAAVSLPTLEAMVRPGVAASREDFLDALFAENLDRKNLDIIEQAHAVDAMVTECGSAAAAAKRLRRTEGWVSQHRALLRLAPELQKHARSGKLPVRIARTIAALPHGEQEAAWHAARDAEAGDREARRQVRTALPGTGDGGQPASDGKPFAGNAGTDGSPAPAGTPPTGGFTGVKPPPPNPDAMAPSGTQHAGTQPGGGSFTAAVKDGDAAGTGASDGTPLGAGPAPVGNGGRPGGDAGGSSSPFTAVNPAGGPEDDGADLPPTRPTATMIRWDDLGQVAGAIRAALSPAERHELVGLITSD